MSDIHVSDTLLIVSNEQHLKEEEYNRRSFKDRKTKRKEERDALLEKFRLQRVTDYKLSKNAKERNENMRQGLQSELVMRHENEKMEEEEFLSKTNWWIETCLQESQEMVKYTDEKLRHLAPYGIAKTVCFELRSKDFDKIKSKMYEKKENLEIISLAYQEICRTVIFDYQHL